MRLAPLTTATLMKEDSKMRKPALLLAAAAFALLGVPVRAGASAALPQIGGMWRGNDDAVYYIMQVGQKIWWAGFGADREDGIDDFWPGARERNAFCGTLNAKTMTIAGDWAEVPDGVRLADGTLTLEVVTGANGAVSLIRRSETGGFKATIWARDAWWIDCKHIRAAFEDLRCKFDHVRRNDGGTMHEHLKVYKDNVALFGTVKDGLQAGFPAGRARTFADFMCGVDNGKYDGDLTFHMVVDRRQLDGQREFWTKGWMNDSKHIRRKWDTTPRDELHPELIMYSRPTTNCRQLSLPLLPGWMEEGANSVLWNGRPIAGNVAIGSSGAATVFGQKLSPGMRVRISGFLALDCHGGDCDEDNPKDHNVEIHPVYAIDVVRDPTAAPTDLSGLWQGDDLANYFVRQIGDEVWWISLSLDRGWTSTSVFRGVIRGDEISGEWVDVPKKWIRGSGTLTISPARNGRAVELRALRSTGPFSASKWVKIRDATAN